MLHGNQYDLIIAYNGINEIYFANNPSFADYENVLASNMLLTAMSKHGVIKSFDLNFYTINLKGLSSVLNGLLAEVQIAIQLKKLSQLLYSNVNLSDGVDELTSSEEDRLIRAASIWEKNIDFMYAVASASGADYVTVLQPTLGLSKDYCLEKSQDCLVSRQKYLLQIRYLYSMLRASCSKRKFCIDISFDDRLTSDETLYTDGRHPNSEGNKRVSRLIQREIFSVIPLPL